MAEEGTRISEIELLAYDMVNGFTQIGEFHSVLELEKCCTIPTASLMKSRTTNNGTGSQLFEGQINAYQFNVQELYPKSQKDDKPVEINQDNVCATHRIMYKPSVDKK